MSSSSCLASCPLPRAARCPNSRVVVARVYMCFHSVAHARARTHTHTNSHAGHGRRLFGEGVAAVDVGHPFQPAGILARVLALPARHAGLVQKRGRRRCGVRYAAERDGASRSAGHARDWSCRGRARCAICPLALRTLFFCLSGRGGQSNEATDRAATHHCTK